MQACLAGSAPHDPLHHSLQATARSECTAAAQVKGAHHTSGPDPPERLQVPARRASAVCR